MNFLTLFLALLITLPVYAENNNGNSHFDDPRQHGHNDGTTDGGDAVSNSESKAEIGNITTSGGSAVGEGGNAQGGNSIGGDVSFDAKRSAPSVYIGSPDTTAPCWVGLAGGGSGPGFGISGLFARRDRACLAMLQFVNLSNLGLAGPAAKAYCEIDANLWKPFNSVIDCEVQMNVPRGTSEAEYDVASGLNLVAEVDIDDLQSTVERLQADIAAMQAKARQSEKDAQRATRGAQQAEEQREVEQSVSQKAWADIKPIVLEK